MKYRFKPTENFWESFYDLSSSQKDSTRRAWKIFRENPFDPRLRAVFFIKDDCIVTVDIGTHDIYKG